MTPQGSLSKEQIYQKLKHFCAYQERCLSEARHKARTFGINATEAEELIVKLVEEDCLNERRFANQFAGGKFRIKQWGKIKIKYQLKQKQVDEKYIKQAIKEIGENEYRDTITKLARKKWEAIKNRGANQFVKKAITRDFLLQRGFESTLINETINKMKK